MRPPKVSAARFARVWNSAANIKDAARELGTTSRAASMRASEYRKRYKIPLQEFKHKGDEVDWDHVRQVAVAATKKRLGRALS